MAARRSIETPIADEMASILAVPAPVDLLTKQGMEPYVSSPDETIALIEADAERSLLKAEPFRATILPLKCLGGLIQRPRPQGIDK